MRHECATQGAFVKIDALFAEAKMAMSSVAKDIQSKSQDLSVDARDFPVSLVDL